MPTMRSIDNSGDTPSMSQSRVALFVSPETTYNKNLDKQNIQFVESIGIFDNYGLFDCTRKAGLNELEWDINAQLYVSAVSDYEVSQTLYRTPRSTDFCEDRLFLLKLMSLTDANNVFSAETANINTNDIQLIQYEYYPNPDYTVSRSNMKVYSFSNSKLYRNVISHSIFYADDGDSSDWDSKPYGFAGTKLGFTVSDSFLKYPGNNRIPPTLCNLRKTNGGQYGGNNYSSRH